MKFAFVCSHSLWNTRKAIFVNGIISGRCCHFRTVTIIMVSGSGRFTEGSRGRMSSSTNSGSGRFFIGRPSISIRTSQAVESLFFRFMPPKTARGDAMVRCCGPSSLVKRILPLISSNIPLRGLLLSGHGEVDIGTRYGPSMVLEKPRPVRHDSFSGLSGITESMVWGMNHM